MPTDYQVENAHLITDKMVAGDEDRLLSAYRPVFSKMGITTHNIVVTIVPDSEWNDKVVSAEHNGVHGTGFMDPEASGITFYYLGKYYIYLRESTSPHYNVGTFSHEVGHISSRLGRLNPNHLISRMVAEFVAERFKCRAEKVFFKLYKIEGWTDYGRTHMLRHLFSSIIEYGLISTIIKTICKPEYTIIYSMAEITQ